MSNEAEAIWGSVLEDAGDFDSMTRCGLLRQLLTDRECGLVRFLIAEGTDVVALCSRLDSNAAGCSDGADSGLSDVLRTSYEVVPVAEVAGQRDRRQTLNTIHFLWGFAADRSAVGTELKAACPSVASLRADSLVWGRWHDSGPVDDAGGDASHRS